MRLRQLTILALALALWLGQLTARPAAACSCVAPGPPSAAFSVMPAVFVGTVNSVTLGGGGQSWLDWLRTLVGLPHLYYSGGLYASLTVSQAWKGVTQTEVEVVTGGGSASCGIDFQLRQDYLIYAWPDTYGLSTNNCTRTALVNAAAADLAYLATQPTLALSPLSGSAWLAVAGLGGAALLVALGALAVVVIRRRARPPKENS